MLKKNNRLLSLIILNLLLVVTAAGCGSSGEGPGENCGNGVLDVGEQCDTGANNSDDGACTKECKSAFCGDGLVFKGTEACDDNNQVSGDGCSASCEFEFSSQTLELEQNARPTLVRATDLDNDGDLDLIVTYEVFFETFQKLVWFKNDGQGNFGNPLLLSTFDPEKITFIDVADIDGDGNKDLVATVDSGNIDKIVWYQNVGGGQFSSEKLIDDQLKAPTIILTNFNGDNAPDILAGSNFLGEEKLVWYQNVGGQFSASKLIDDQMGGVRSLAASDIDGDGKVDAIAASGYDNGVIGWYQNNGQGGFNGPKNIDHQPFPATVFAVDFNHNNSIDIIIDLPEANGGTVWYQNSDMGNFFPKQTLIPQSESFTMVDLDLDGNLDILSETSEESSIVWYRNNGEGTFSNKKTISTECDVPSRVSTGDFDGDNDIDLVAIFNTFSNCSKIILYKNGK